MEELALKPLNPIDASYSNQVVDEVTRTELVYRYGEDISKWGVILPFTKNHTSTGTILTMFDDNGDTYYKFNTTDGGTNNTTIIIDFGKILEVRGYIATVALTVNGATAIFKTDYTLDGTTWTNLATSTLTAAGAVVDNFYDQVAALTRLRSIRISFESTNNPGSDKICKIYQVKVIV